MGIPASISVAVAIGLSVMFKLHFSRPRPSVLRLIEETGFSFPSAHAMLSSALYIMLIILVCKYLKSILAKIVLVPCLSALILVVAYSRVYLGVHYITDIIGGWLIGFAITLIVYTVCRLTLLKDKEQLHANARSCSFYSSIKSKISFIVLEPNKSLSLF
ncbi:MAG: phosphatase PAP2 family protein [Acutalibacteraceae bacterium]